ncbi:MAG: hydrogenobyrinic acid a,c-diamide synthase (glutamine-hydrolyzing), partial [Candidatus Methanomethylophilaceae archaeon]|nr:hydrogenobyrinic acid a,c-diamide synthase (glutamine-hydrolyzing) [Candidatus Methanomethylophilaceae archaeon]
SDEGKIIIGECGGLMTLCSSIVDLEGKSYKMAGIFDGDAVMCGRHGPTYNIAKPTSCNPVFSETVKGHSFHYSEIRLRKPYPLGFDLERGQGVEDHADGLVAKRTIGSYTHQHALSCRDWMGSLMRE